MTQTISAADLRPDLLLFITLKLLYEYHRRESEMIKTNKNANFNGAKFARLSPSDMKILSDAEQTLCGKTGQTVALVAFDAEK